MEKAIVKTIEVTIYERESKARYCPTTEVCVGKTVVATYGWNYAGAKDSVFKYAVSTKVLSLKKELRVHKTRDEARELAYIVADVFLDNLNKIDI